MADRTTSPWLYGWNKASYTPPPSNTQWEGHRQQQAYKPGVPSLYAKLAPAESPLVIAMLRATVAKAMVNASGNAAEDKLAPRK